MDNSTGTYQIWTSPIEFSSLDDVNNNNSEKIKLKQNFPNPFKETTTIGYNISTFGLVSLKVFDALGNRIDVIINEMQMPGYHEVTYSPSISNQMKRVLFYQLSAEGVTHTKSMILSN
jgi:hypothetical protein